MTATITHERRGRPCLDRLPFGDLQRLCGAVHDRLLADVAGVSRRTIIRWRQGGLPLWAADELAVWAGFHPAEVWTDWG